ncbi:MAG: acetylglutamate kinase [Lutibacter sp.]|uniref:acetylglutamate kinase n=1 Tax=Lutibacter sp. TaxID=1925666 RepID=UPI00299CD4BE|nr:acetylglutamate kinase [Lutibacter sp.]MDX1829354.1 acetylglutamate kinase [Lutibacter sp.]
MTKQKLHIVKIGGNVINDDGALRSFLKDFSVLEGFKILIHGGGNKATEIASEMGLKPKMINGRRVTDKANLEVVTMVYAGLLNKKVTAILQQNNCNAIGLSGADANCILANKRIVKDVDYGFAGDIDVVNSETINMFLQHNIVPVFCAITHDKKGQLLNTNADTIASEVAIAMSNLFNVELSYVFELKGVLSSIEDENSVIKEINLQKYKQLIEQNIISDGMLPKMDNCFNALKKGVQKVKIGNSSLIKKTTDLYTTLSLR